LSRECLKRAKRIQIHLKLIRIHLPQLKLFEL
jgi:hypothetical protein